MAIYSIWNNKGGVGKSYLTFQIACEYARIHQEQKVLVADMCPQANASGMLLGGMIRGEKQLCDLGSQNPSRTIAGYIEDRIRSPYVSPRSGASYAVNVSQFNDRVPANLYLLAGDEQLEIQTSRVLNATNPGPTDAWRIVHTWISDLIEDVKYALNENDLTVFIDCNPSFSIYTELAMSASDRLIIPFSADGSSKRAVRAVLSLLYGVTRRPGAQQSLFHLNSQRFRLPVPQIYCYVGNRLTQYVKSAKAFRTVVQEIGDEIFAVWQGNSNVFCIHPSGKPVPNGESLFRDMFQFEIVDANTASVVSSTLGIPIVSLTAGQYTILEKDITVNQSQLDRQQPNIKSLVSMIE
ncbi:ParA family protein [Desulfonema magnum]|uniref:AAA ATPase-like domain-containing protein n=1 Tax=Desulfonema magnum TaxID=45655 RepID=A0A975BHN5_9BACT|nr:ParA family protein [Desulfonema magnum]QTA85503.1 AAA ATPase-like domain-containing protein [Desulfonema magnum]